MSEGNCQNFEIFDKRKGPLNSDSEVRNDCAHFLLLFSKICALLGGQDSGWEANVLLVCQKEFIISENWQEARLSCDCQVVNGTWERATTKKNSSSYHMDQDFILDTVFLLVSAVKYPLNFRVRRSLDWATSGVQDGKDVSRCFLGPVSKSFIGINLLIISWEVGDSGNYRKNRVDGIQSCSNPLPPTTVRFESQKPKGLFSGWVHS